AWAAELRGDGVAQLVDVHARGVDDLVGERTELREHAPLLRDALLDAAIRAERMPPARFGEPADQGVVGAVEEHHLELMALAADLVQRRRGGVEEASLAG